MAKDKEQKNGSRLAGGVISPHSLGETKEDWIGNQLKRIYDEALLEDIPDDMLNILSQLDSKSKDNESNGEDSR